MVTWKCNDIVIYIAVTTAMEGRGGVGECPHAGVSPLHPVPHQNGKRYKTYGHLKNKKDLI
jgi:hypothetical protein